MTKSQVIDEGGEIHVNLRFIMAKLDPIGESKIWYMWMFYNDAERCAQISGTCLKDGRPIDGTDQPRTYTTYYTWGDFFSRQEVETIFWIMLATSFIVQKRSTTTFSSPRVL